MEMEKRIDLQDNIIQQLQTNLSDVARDEGINTSLIYNNLVENGFISISPPLEEPRIISFMTMDSLRDYKNGNSIKPGNIFLNMKKLIKAIPEAVSIASGMINNKPILTVCGALCLWSKLRNVATIKVSKEQAFVIVALWKECDSHHEISLYKGFTATNDLLSKYGEPEITSLKYNKLIDSLVKIRCIELTAEVIWLREWISKKYIYSM